MNNNGLSFTITDNSNKTITYDILFTFSSDETKKSYMVFTDNTKDEYGSIVAYAAVYKEDDGNLELMDIQTDEEWNLIENILSQLDEKVEG